MGRQNWYVVQTKARQEKIAEENLRRQGFKTYCPYTLQPKRRRNSWQQVIEPLFPRYLFIQFNTGIDNFAPVRSTSGALGLIRFGNQPAVMPASAIDTIQLQEQMLNSHVSAHPCWQKGDILEVKQGPFAGLSGIFQKKKGTDRVLLLLNILGTKRNLSINIDDIEAA